MDRVVEREQSRHDWTARRLFSQRREIYEVIVRMLGAGFPVRLIADFCQVTEKSVVAVREAEPVAVTAFRDRLGVRRRNVIARSLDVIATKMEDGSKESVATAKDAAIVMNILDQQDRLDSGAPTARLEITGVPGEEEFRRFLSASLAKAHDVDAEPADTGLTRAAAPAKGDAFLSSPALPDPDTPDHP